MACRRSWGQGSNTRPSSDNTICSTRLFFKWGYFISKIQMNSFSFLPSLFFSFFFFWKSEDVVMLDSHVLEVMPEEWGWGR